MFFFGCFIPVLLEYIDHLELHRRYVLSYFHHVVFSNSKFFTLALFCGHITSHQQPHNNIMPSWRLFSGLKLQSNTIKSLFYNYYFIIQYFVWASLQSLTRMSGSTSRDQSCVWHFLMKGTDWKERARCLHLQNMKSTMNYERTSIPCRTVPSR